MQIGVGIFKKWTLECSGLAWFCQ